MGLDVEQCFDRVNHDQLMSLVTGRVADRRVLQRIDRDLKAGVLPDAGLEATGAGTPHGGPWSPLRAHRRLDGLDQELAHRGHRFVRDAADDHIDVKSVQAGQRVRARVTRFVERRLQLRGNDAKRAGDRPWRRTCLGCTCTGHRPNRRRVSETAWRAVTQEGRRLTARTRGVALGQVLRDLRRDLDGWYGYVGVAEAQSGFQALDCGLRRRLRGDQWKPWGRRRYRARRRRGISREWAWNTVRSAHGPWRVRRRPALAIALPGSDFDGLGLPRLQRGSQR